jgi:hypothetical protein
MDRYFALTTTDELGRAWYLFRPSSSQGSMIRTSDPLSALVFPSIERLQAWVDHLPAKWAAQLAGRTFQIREITVEIALVEGREVCLIDLEAMKTIQAEKDAAGKAAAEAIFEQPAEAEDDQPFALDGSPQGDVAPSRGRGLKQGGDGGQADRPKSPPSRGRGLKPAVVPRGVDDPDSAPPSGERSPISEEPNAPAPSSRRPRRGLVARGGDPGEAEGAVAVAERPDHRAKPRKGGLVATAGGGQAFLPGPAPSGRREPRQFQPSPQQKEFLRGLLETEAHVLLEALAGTGKSTTCREGAWALEEAGLSSVYCCFNKSIADEFQKDLPQGCRAQTMHSLGLRMLRNAFGDALVDWDKGDRLAEKYFPGRDGRYHRSAVGKLAGLAKNLLLEDTGPEALAELAADHEVELPDDSAEDVLAVVPEVLAASREWDGSIDGDDMIWLPVVLGLKAPRSPDVLFVDEAQDLNRCQHAMTDLICPRGRIGVIGDRHQSIYAFRGADSQSIPTFEGKLAATDRGLRTYPLTVTRRCPVRHVELARRLVPALDHLPDAPEGSIEVVGPEKWADRVAPGDLVLCRTNAPLVSACYRLIRSGTRAAVRGRDIGKGLLALVARLRPATVGDLLRKLGDYRAREAQKLAELRNPGPRLAALNDKVDCLVSLCEGATSVDDVRGRAESLFTDAGGDDQVVVLSSVHRAKGLERDRVVILRPDLLPGPWADSADDVVQERNLTYVAVTRSKQSLIFAGSVPAILR